ncbi:hypothetical protein ASF70_03000 [Rhizobium sp. Leaf321]|jgi:methyl-accepting chemotaxis protein|uniref:HAMP domain-containing protein n=1 Tax=Rhizobium sp. Leaf321 TaxID=1736335 RepID=UPI000715D245|nr:HAMP domain-containing protein [Rhizobium sp. Leaf321]KQQ74882.1 hypothetical protein ASF70_03000 [Rhizobium sp. Leaf321]
MQKARPYFVEWLAAINRFIDYQETQNKTIGADVSEAAGSFPYLQMIGLGSALVLAALSIWAVIASVTVPLNAIAKAIGSLAHGNVDVLIYSEGRSDEIGAMASTVAIFRDKVRERSRLEEEASANRPMSEQERMEREKRRAVQSDF